MRALRRHQGSNLDVLTWTCVMHTVHGIYMCRVHETNNNNNALMLVQRLAHRLRRWLNTKPASGDHSFLSEMLGLSVLFSFWREVADLTHSVMYQGWRTDHPPNHFSRRQVSGEYLSSLRSSLSKYPLNPISAEIDFRRLNLTSMDVRFWRIKSVYALKDCGIYNGRKPIQMKRKKLTKTFRRISNCENPLVS